MRAYFDKLLTPNPQQKQLPLIYPLLIALFSVSVISFALALYHYLWALGGRGILLEWGKLALGVGGRYSYCNYKPSWLTTNAVPVTVSRTHLRWRQWQADIDLSYRIDLFTPYFGVKYSGTEAKIGLMPIPIAGNGSGTDHFRTRTPVGIFIGCSISSGKYFMLNIEGRLVDEDAVTISGDLRF